MCGLVGILSSTTTAKHAEVLTSMLYVDTWRGKDSTGVAAIRRDQSTSVLKATVPGYEFVEGPRLSNFLRTSDICWIGHNRFGTVGGNIKSNAHPFQILDEDGACLVVGAHNGTLRNRHVLTDYNNFGTDSEALYNEIALVGVKDAIAKVEGAWALTFVDHYRDYFGVIRNSERTLFWALQEDKKTLFWASEEWMIRVCVNRAGLKLLDNKVHSFDPDTLYKFKIPDKWGEEISFETEGGVVGKQAPAFFQHNRSWGHQQRTEPSTTAATSSGRQQTGGESRKEAQTGRAETTTSKGPSHQSSLSMTKTEVSGDNQPSQNSTSTKTLSLPPPTDKGKVVPIEQGKIYRGYKAVPLTRKEIMAQLEDGCVWCEIETPTPEERFAWVGEGQPVCGRCLSDNHSKIITKEAIN